MIGVMFDGDVVVRAMDATTLPDGWTKVVVTDDTGILLAGEIAVAAPVSFDQVTVAMKSGDWIVPRPETPVPLVSVSMVTIPPVPNGTVVTIVCADETWTFTADQDGWTEVFDLSDAGHYAIEVRAPLPHMPSQVEVTIP